METAAAAVLIVLLVGFAVVVVSAPAARGAGYVAGRAIAWITRNGRG